jgi:hypothetical protein
MPDVAHPNAMPPNDWNAAFASLPLETPAVDGWSRLSDALNAHAAARSAASRRNRWLAIAAALATVAVVPAMLIRQHGTTLHSAKHPAPIGALASTAMGAASRTPPTSASTPPQATASTDTRKALAHLVDSVSTGQAVTSIAKAAPHRMATHTSSSIADRSASVIPGEPIAAASADAGAADQSDHADGLMQLQAESARLEALVAMTRDDRVGNAAATVMTAELDQHIGLIDAGLTQSPLSGEQREALWRDRVQTLRELAGIETTQLWLASQGERYDGALVNVD